jgi:hypothetical protein
MITAIRFLGLPIVIIPAIDAMKPPGNSFPSWRSPAKNHRFGDMPGIGLIFHLC